ncbi:serine hydrolase domain-containing protein [Micromonospora matsumotoense]|uniref:serine hydrolase domain-containing protein n=1 Tax=Micromonospora matsumotoense TaxID=121616 RepID=UPI0033F5AEED
MSQCESRKWGVPVFSMVNRPTREPRSAGGWRRGVITAAMVSVAAAGVTVTGVASADVSKAGTGNGRDKALQAALDAAVQDGSLPGALMSVRDRHGRVTNYTAGVGDIRTGAKVPTDGYVRIASNTKMFTAVVILQLVGEGNIALTDPVEKFLPGVVRGTGAGAAIDGRRITIEQLLQHTSGLGSYTFLDEGILPIRNRFFEPRELLDSALTQPPTYTPGQDPVWEYSNAGYVALGLVAQKVTGRPLAEVITDRILKPAGLRETYYPGPGQRGIRAPHPQGYLFAQDGKLMDITRFDPSIAGAAGQMIATPTDMNKFLVALQDGRLLKPRELAKMRRTVSAPRLPEGWSYGLGTIKFELSCGVTAYGHGGDADGFQSRIGITTDGRAVTLVGTNDEAKVEELLALFDKALCAGK